MLSASIFGPRPARALLRVSIMLGLVFILSRFIVSPTLISGNSMAPSYENLDINFIYRPAYRKTDPARGDVVAVQFDNELLVKRIVGLPGERIGIFFGQVIIDGEWLDEPYVRFNSGWILRPIELGPDEYLIIGDNRGMSMEDHTFGAVQRDAIIGKLLF